MTKPSLYRKKISDVAVVLTAEAHAALMEIASYFVEHDGYDGMKQELWGVVALGYYTFILDTHYAVYPISQKVYTGGLGLLDEVSKAFTVRAFQTDHPFPLSFAGNFDWFEELEKQGWGPKTERFVEMFHGVRRAALA